MEFIIVPLFFGVALFLLSVGKFFGKKQGVQHSCSSKKNIEGASCGACSDEDLKFYKSKDDPGFGNVAKLGYPRRNKRFVDKHDFKPERFN
jgi:hypothetical protein